MGIVIGRHFHPVVLLFTACMKSPAASEIFPMNLPLTGIRLKSSIAQYSRDLLLVSGV
jgi:hypothetical protein